MLRTSGSRVTRRAFLGGLATAAAGSLIAACTPAAKGPGPHGSDTVQLVYQDWGTEWFPGLAQQMLEQFRATHPNIHVFYASDPENVAEQMLVDMQAGTAADVVAGCCDSFPVWAQKGYLLDLRPFIQADIDRATIDDWDPAQFKALSLPGGAQFGLPKYHGTLGLYYNKDLFDRYRVDYPNGSWTHDDYLQAMQKLSADATGGGRRNTWGSMIDINWERLQVHVNGWGGHFVDPNEPRRCLLGQAEALAALGWIRSRMWDDHMMATALDAGNLSTTQAFVQGRLGMVEDSSLALKEILEQAKFRVGVAPFPAGPVRRVTISGTDGWGIYAGTRYPEAAWELLKFLISPAFGLAMARGHLLQPARASLTEEWIQYIRAQYGDRAQGIDLQAFVEGRVQGYSVTREVFLNMAEAGRLARAAWQRIFTLGEAPVDIMKKVAFQIEDAQR